MTFFDAGKILKVLDNGARDFVFPMLDNGYVYPAAARLSLHLSASDWGLVFETFGFSPRAGCPDLFITTFTSRPKRNSSAQDYVRDEAFSAYLISNPYSERVCSFPIEDESWIDTNDGELVAKGAATLTLRGETIALPSRGDYERAGVEIERPEQPYSYELARTLAHVHRESVLATALERRSALPDGMEQIMLLEDWHHPDVVADELPSSTETFQQLASVLATGDVAKYRTREPNNTHWSNWPDGGTL